MKLEQVKSELKTQGDIREEKVRISGPVSSSLKSFLSNSIDYLDSLRNTAEGKVNEEAIKRFALELGINDKELEESFNDGLRYNIKTAYKIGLLDKNSSPEDIKHIISAYTLSFRSALSKFKKFGKKEEPNTILNVAQRMYILPPTILKDLREKFKDNELVDERMIRRFAVSNPENPEIAIERTLALIPQLKKKFEGNKLVEDWMIKRSAIYNPDDPEAAIEKFISKRTL